jgi:tetratricopeptide (TPR) repeat protein
VANPAGRGAAVVEGARAVAPAVLARLHRAAGDCPAAVAAARRSGDPVLLQEMLLAAGHWGALAEAAADRPAPAQTPKQLGLLAAAHHLAGDARGFDDALARMRKLAKPETLNDVAETLFLGGRAGEGLRLLEGGGSATAVPRLKVLAAQERWDEAWALLESQETARDEAALSLRVAAAEQWHGLGEMRHAADLLARVARENAALDSPEVHALLGETYRKIGQPDAAWPHFRAAMKLADGRNADAGRMVWLAFRVDVDRDGEHEVNGANVWEFVGGRFRGEGVDAQFDRTRSIVEGMMPLEELKRLAGDRRHSQRAHAAGLPLLIGHRMNADGQEADAVQYLAEAAENAPAPEYALQLYLRLGDWAAARRDWPKAAGFYGRAWNADRRHEAVKVLHEHRIDAALWGEVDVILRTVRPGMLPADFAQRLSAERAVREGNWLAAANGYERSALNYVAFYDLPDPAAYLRIADTVRRMRAKGMLAKGDVEAAEREIAGSRTALPGDVMMPIDVIPEFERLGKKARADELYADVMGRLDTILAKHPGSANHHNSAAWLAVNCGRDADKALAHARRAVELQPDRAAYLDTLAEVLFRRGEIDEAMRMITRCAELDPRSPRHREQLDRFEAAKRGESRPMPPG